jgi:hypothetical protein
MFYHIRFLKNSIIRWLSIAFEFNLKIFGGSLSWLFIKTIKPIFEFIVWIATSFCDHLFTKKEMLKKGLIIFKPGQLIERLRTSRLGLIISLLQITSLRLIKMLARFLSNFCKSKSIAIILTIAVFLISTIKQTQYFRKTVHKIITKCSFTSKQELHPFASKVNLVLSLNDLAFEKHSTNASGTIAFDFQTGTECLDLLKKFEFQKTISYSKQHYMTTHNLVTTSAIFEFLTKTKPEILTKYFPQQISKLNISLINKSLFSEEADFIVGKESIKINNEIKEANNIFASKYISQKAELLSNTQNSISHQPQRFQSF